MKLLSEVLEEPRDAPISFARVIGPGRIETLAERIGPSRHHRPPPATHPRSSVPTRMPPRRDFPNP